MNINDNEKFAFYKKNIFKNNDFLPNLLNKARTSITIFGKRKIIFSNGETENLKDFLRDVVKNIQYDKSNNIWKTTERLLKENEFLLNNASLIQKMSNFFRDIFSDATKIPYFASIIYCCANNEPYKRIDGYKVIPEWILKAMQNDKLLETMNQNVGS